MTQAGRAPRPRRTGIARRAGALTATPLPPPSSDPCQRLAHVAARLKPESAERQHHRYHRGRAPPSVAQGSVHGGWLQEQKRQDEQWPETQPPVPARHGGRPPRDAEERRRSGRGQPRKRAERDHRDDSERAHRNEHQPPGVHRLWHEHHERNPDGRPCRPRIARSQDRRSTRSPWRAARRPPFCRARPSRTASPSRRT